MLKNILQNMTLREKLGQLIMMDFRFWGKDKNGNYISACELNHTIKDLISKYHLGGIALFRENTGTPAQIIKLVEDIQADAKIPLLFGIDQEGGIVTRLQTGTDMPGNMVLGAANDYTLTKEVAKAIGRELNVLGINLNFAPTVDVNSSPSNPIIGVRSFSSSPELVGKMGKAFIKGLKEASVLSCIKHFPGHGNTVNDTHLELATVDYSYEELEKIDLKPFEETIQAGADSIMIAHVIVPALDDSKQKSKKDEKEIGTPATLSYKIITELLRNKLKFDGLVLTDALDMKAISDNFGNEEATIKTILAGSDMAVMPVRIWEEKDIYKLENLFVTLEKECSNNPAFLVRVKESVERVISLKIKKDIINNNKVSIDKKIKEASHIVGCNAHKLIERKASSRGITLIKNDNNILPFKLEENSKILILDSNKTRINLLSNNIRQVIETLGKSATINKQMINFTDMLSNSLEQQILEADFIILLTYNLDSSTTLPEQIATFADSNNKKLVSIACRNPYDIAYIPSCKANMAIYGAVGFDQTNAIQAILTVNLETVSGALFIGNNNRILLKPIGKLPVTIENSVTKEILYKIGHGLGY